MQEKIKMSDISYVDYMCKELVQSLENFMSEQVKQGFIHSSQNRAKFKRLRVELAKRLIDIQNRIY